MSTQEKPLNVRCAESLGWKRCTEQEGCEGWCDPSGERDCESHYDPLPPYGDDTPEGWACTGPLLERFRLSLCYTDYNNEAWIADRPGSPPGSGVMAHSASEAIARWAATFATRQVC